MTTEQKKETISNSIIRLLANLQGFKISIPEQDHGVDMVVTKVKTYNVLGKNFFIDYERIELQLKCTTLKNVIYTKEGLKFDLKVKNYNDLVIRRTSIKTHPLMLLLIVLPDNPAEWVKIKENQMIISHKSYWFYPEKNVILSDNRYKVRISISEKNQITTNSFQKLFDNFFEKEI